MLVIREKINNKYIKPKYGRGFHSKYTPVLRHDTTECGSSSVKSNDGKIAIDRAIDKVVEPSSDKKKQVLKRKRAPSVKKKTPDNVNKKPRKSVANAKKTKRSNNNNNNNIDWGDRKLNDLIKNS